MLMHNCLITSGPGEEPTITGTGITVACILERLSFDDSIETICDNYHLSKEQVHAALSYAETNLSHLHHYTALDAMLDAFPSDDGLDYGLLTANAGYFSTDSCPIQLLNRYRKRVKHHHMSRGAGVGAGVGVESRSRRFKLYP